MNIEEIKTLAEVGVEEVKAGCYRVSAKSGHWLQVKTSPDPSEGGESEAADNGETVTDCIYMGAEADVALTITTNAEKIAAERRKATEGMTLDEVKEYVIKEITEYDSSSNVNNFALNGNSVWLDKATRVGLVNSTTICKEAGQATTTLWLNGMKLVIDCDKALQLLAALELYALECFNVTAAHKAEVAALTSVEEVEAYDITKDYPDKLSMSV